MTIRRLGMPEEEYARKERLRALVRECPECGRLNFWGTFPCGHVVGTIEEFTEWFCAEIRAWPDWQKKAFREGVVPDCSGRIQ
jgi:hypothetical protein